MGTNLKRVAMLAVTAVLALSACGGDDSDDVSAGGAVESLPGEATDGGADATDAPSGTDAADDSDATGDTAGDIELDGEFCSATAQMMERVDDMETATSAADPIAGLSDAFAQLGEIGGALEDLEGTAPEELKDDVATLSDAFGTFQDQMPEIEQFIEDMQEAGTDPAALQEVMSNYSDLMTSLDLSAIDSPEVEQAGENISDYVRDVCGLDIGS
jgi:archaellum component FlaC